MAPTDLDVLVADIRACRICESHLEPRPVLRVSATARICIVGQAPGIRVHRSGMPFTDPSGDRLRAWMGVDTATFYDDSRVAIVPMGFCFPGYTKSGADKPPRQECAAHWRKRLFAELPAFDLTLAIGAYAQAWHLKGRTKESMSETVRAFRDYAPQIIPLPHPSWRNNAWLKTNLWFKEELLPYLQQRVRAALDSD